MPPDLPAGVPAGVPSDLPAVLRSASVAEVAWRAGDELRVRGVLPLVSEGRPVLAFPYADEPTARSLGAASEALLTLTDPRSTGTAFAPVLLRCRPRLSEDREGDIFAGDLLGQELRRYPPSRLLADSFLLRREHWWWLPRLLVELEVVGREPFAARSDPEHHLLVVDSGPPDRPLTAVIARVRDQDGPTVDVLSGTPAPGPALLFGQDVSYPDMERWGQWSWQGEWDGARLVASSSPDRVGLPPVPGVLTRWRRQRDLERRCRAGLR